MGLHLWSADGGGADGAVRRVVEFALTQMEPGKILLGFPNYAYDWTLPFTAGATRAQSIGNEAAPLLAAQYGAEIQFDEQAQTPYFTYQDEAGQPHEVWFEDARSALAKFGLLTEYGLSGARLLELHAAICSGIQPAELPVFHPLSNR